VLIHRFIDGFCEERDILNLKLHARYAAVKSTGLLPSLEGPDQQRAQTADLRHVAPQNRPLNPEGIKSIL